MVKGLLGLLIVSLGIVVSLILPILFLKNDIFRIIVEEYKTNRVQLIALNFIKNTYDCISEISSRPYNLEIEEIDKLSFERIKTKDFSLFKVISSDNYINFRVLFNLGYCYNSTFIKIDSLFDSDCYYIKSKNLGFIGCRDDGKVCFSIPKCNPKDSYVFKISIPNGKDEIEVAVK